MIIDDSILTREEKLIFSLRSLYNENGFEPYKMSKFEEYDLYAKNRDFLISGNIISFTDCGGRLMALKPDVTLSIIKNLKDAPEKLTRLYYDENVYRANKAFDGFKELRQSGVEAIGEVKKEDISNILLLACKSLEKITEDYVIDVSSLDILGAVINYLTSNDAVANFLTKAVSEKNIHESEKICLENGVEKEKAQALSRLIGAYGKPCEVLPEIEKIASQCNAMAAFENFKAIVEGAECEKINIDFSVVSDMNYYNGIIFNGFINTVPDSVLSGGQYDKLMKKAGKRSNAVGFAVYIDKVLG